MIPEELHFSSYREGNLCYSWIRKPRNETVLSLKRHVCLVHSLSVCTLICCKEFVCKGEGTSIYGIWSCHVVFDWPFIWVCLPVVYCWRPNILFRYIPWCCSPLNKECEHTEIRSLILSYCNTPVLCTANRQRADCSYKKFTQLNIKTTEFADYYQRFQRFCRTLHVNVFNTSISYSVPQTTFLSLMIIL